MSEEIEIEWGGDGESGPIFRVEGLEDEKAYYINNSVVLCLSYTRMGGEELEHYEVRFEGRNSKTVVSRFHPFEGGSRDVTVDISMHLRSIYGHMPPNEVYTRISTWEQYGVSVSVWAQEGWYLRQISRVDIGVIKGGERNNKTNITAVDKSILSPIDKIPVWKDYPFALYELYCGGYGHYRVFKLPYSELSTKEYNSNYLEMLEIMPEGVRGGGYVKFYNSKGGYSYYLFENYAETQSTSDKGYSNFFGEVVDFGKQSETVLTLKSRVQAKYIELMKDLIESPQVLLYNRDTGDWSPIVPRSNKIEDSLYGRYYDVSLSFSLVVSY